jgi:hypothetical protein
MSDLWLSLLGLDERGATGLVSTKEEETNERFRRIGIFTNGAGRDFESLEKSLIFIF